MLANCASVSDNQMFTKAIVRPPSCNFAEGLTSARLGPPDFALALKQHEAYCAALEQCGLTVMTLPPDDLYPDSCFVEDTAVLTSQGAVLTRPGATSRGGEVVSIRKALAEFFPSTQEIAAPGTLDGGDVCQAANHFFIGLSNRTNEAGATQFAQFLTSFGYTSTIIDIRANQALLHLKSGLAYLGDNRMLMIEAISARREFRGYERLIARGGEEYATNCVRVNGHVLIAAGFPGMEAQLRERAYETIPLDMSEFQKMDGGLSCLSLRF